MKRFISLSLMVYPTIFLLAFIIMAGCTNSLDGELLLIEPDSENSFNYPYYLFIPKDVPAGQEVYIIVEPNNSGFADDNFEKHLEKAERTASRDFYAGNYVSRKMHYPLIIPVFPRSMTDWKIYTHALDRDVILQSGGKLERIDKQLIEMHENARIYLKNRNINTKDKMLMTGFSASGTFANRFSLIHPDKVFAIAAGGINGLLMLPMDSLYGEDLKYPLGTGDFNQLFDSSFQKSTFLKVHQYYFMGRLDDNDAVPYEDAFNPSERDQIFRLLGEEMQPARWQNCQSIYKSENVNAVFSTFENIGHEQPELIKNSIVEFFRQCISTSILVQVP